MKGAADSASADAQASRAESRKISTDLWPKISALVEGALELPEAERKAYLERACAGDDFLLREAQALLEPDPEVLERVSSSPVEGRGAIASIGPYEVISEIGQGGMAKVFLCRLQGRADPRPVAVKLLDQGFIGHDVKRRFDREGEILGRFRHPHIAALYGNGNARDGRPYLVMEWVEGKPIDRYCREQELDCHQTLQLFRRLCQVVAYAHRNLVVHRDLKPPNILITSAGEPKLLDFGISKLLDPDSRVSQTVTLKGWQAMTPQYASPEQIRGLPATTSCDIYGLGVVLYQLLTGARPFDGRGDALLDRICREEPLRPSKVVPESGHGGLDPRQLRGDLDNIVLKALAKEPRQRYGSVQELDADLERYLTDRPVLARPPHLAYSLAKLLRRRRRLFVGLIAALLVLATTAVERERQRHKVARERDKAVAIQDFLIEVFGKSDPRQGHDGSTSVSEILHQGVAQIDRLDGEPEVQGDLAQILGQIYLNLGILEGAQTLLERALQLHLEYRGESDSEVAATRDLLGQYFDAIGQYDDAAHHLELALAIRRQETPVDDLSLTAVLNNLALTRLHQGQLEEAARLGRENLELRRKVWGAGHLELAVAFNNLGYILRGIETTSSEELIDLFSRGLELRLEHLGELHPDVAVSYNNVGSVWAANDDPMRAGEYFRKAIDIWRHFLGDHHRDVLVGELNLVTVLERTGELGPARELLEGLMARISAQLGPEHPLYVHAGKILKRLEGAAEKASATPVEEAPREESAVSGGDLPS